MFDKFKYVDFKQYQTEQELIEEAHEIYKVEEQAITESVINDNEPLEETMIPSKEESVEHPKSTHDMELEIIRHHQETEKILAQIRDAIRDVEMQQNGVFQEFTSQCFRFVIAISKKIFRGQAFSSVYIDVLQRRISEVMDKFRKGTVLSLSMPEMSNEMRSNLISIVKNTADKLNIEIKENAIPTDTVELSWENGKAEIDVEGTISEIENKLIQVDLKE